MGKRWKHGRRDCLEENRTHRRRDGGARDPQPRADSAPCGGGLGHRLHRLGRRHGARAGRTHGRAVLRGCDREAPPVSGPQKPFGPVPRAQGHGPGRGADGQAPPKRGLFQGRLCLGAGGLWRGAARRAGGAARVGPDAGPCQQALRALCQGRLHHLSGDGQGRAPRRLHGHAAARRTLCRPAQERPCGLLPQRGKARAHGHGRQLRRAGHQRGGARRAPQAPAGL